MRLENPITLDEFHLFDIPERLDMEVNNFREEYPIAVIHENKVIACGSIPSIPMSKDIIVMTENRVDEEITRRAVVVEWYIKAGDELLSVVVKNLYLINHVHYIS